jgi:PAS domain S-box-containing protein
MTTTSKRVLVVEDEALAAHLIKSILHQHNYEVLAHVSSGEEAIRKAAELQPDIILMDIHLKGGMDGVETAEVILSQQDVPIIYLTGNADITTVDRAKITHPYAYLLKPFKPIELLTAIEISFFKHQSEKELRENRLLLETTLKGISDAVIAINSEGSVIFTNPVAEQLTGWPKEEAIGANIAEVLKIASGGNRSFLANPLAWLQKFKEAGKLPEVNILASKTGAEYFVEYNASLNQNAKGNITGAVITFKDITARKEAEGKLLEMEKQKQAQEKEMHRISTLSLLKGQEKERQRISRDIHDSLGQILTALRLNIQTLNMKNDDADDLGHERIQMIKDLLTEAISEARRISHDLMPVLLSDFGLAAAARQLVEQLSVSSGINIHLEHNLDNDRLEQSIEISMYRILQEALNNSVKYSKAKDIWISMKLNGHSIQLEVRDNGIGIDPERIYPRPSLKDGGKGIYNMQERANLLGGKFELSAQPEKGCKIVVNIPLKYS